MAALAALAVLVCGRVQPVVMPWRPRRWLRAPLAVLAALLLAALTAIVLVVDSAPRVAARDDVSPADVARAVALARAQDPRLIAPGGVRTLQLSTRDIELLLNHAAHRIVQARVAVVLQSGAARVDASAPLAHGLWLNLRSRWAEQEGVARIASLHVGALPVPAWLGARLLRALARRDGAAGELEVALGLLQRVSLRPGTLVLTYRVEGRSPRRMLEALVPPEEQQRLQVYVARLAELTRQRAAGSVWPLTQALAPLFELAQQRTDRGAAATHETRAALLVLTAYANGLSLEQWLAAARGWPRPVRLRVTLDGRADFALHFLISALLAIDGTSPLSRAVGVYKEMSDAHGGSGFSFNDIAADRAGTRLGELALASPLVLLQRLAGDPGARVSDRALMPPWRDLPEGLPEAEFLREYGGVGAPDYERMLAEIDRRIAALPLLR